MNLDEFLDVNLCFINIEIDGEMKSLSDNKNEEGFYFVEGADIQFAPIANVSRDFNGIFSMPDVTGKSFTFKPSKAIIS